MKTKDRQAQKPEAKTKTMEEKVQTLRQVFTELKAEAENLVKDCEPTNPFVIEVSGKIEGFRIVIELVDLIDHLKPKDEQRHHERRITGLA